MSEAAKKFMNMGIWCSVLLFIFRCWIDWNNLSSIVTEHKIAECSYSLYGYTGEAIGIATIFMTFFNKWLWM